jgi:hypothetical protein
MKKNTLRLAVIIFVILSTTSCISRTKSILVDNPCRPPCWYGITPGQTNQEEALKILKGIPEINWQSINSDLFLSKLADGYRWKFINAKETDGEIAFSNGITEAIHIEPGNSTIAKIFDLYGEPDTYLAFYQSIEFTIWGVYLFYPERGLIIGTDSLYTHNLDNVILKKNAKVAEVIFLPKEDIYRYIIDNPLDITEEFISENTYAWNGLGELVSARLNITN